jgi:hypothetical protein
MMMTITKVQKRKHQLRMMTRKKRGKSNKRLRVLRLLK